MVRNGAVHPRWVLRRDERRAGRYDGDKVVRWIARPTLMKGRTKESGTNDAEDDSAGFAPPSRPNGFAGLRIVSDN
ncbi:hypothetical protein MPPM_3329 [Methylorubrum populi]|uniref:Uncharacterized protein n=1 Tax=Methylorubrum populi TaxID=223967 RepID=A0A160PGM5_9HYPH|nr:hypothetical protein [Methylorubrum populi]BAU91934.1 hypothetical protein MPPM_3329 [Methylorubrum populi]